ncbi:MAG: lipoprotein signal peptidase [Gammaproteobacteria bacterium]|nr:MAG: lipoprotein signal peptidase [Gammaproteobacteria bacterium]
MRDIRLWRWYGLAILVFVADWLTKQWALSALVYAVPVKILPVLDFTLVYNRGAAFSFLSEAGGWQRWFFALVATLASVILAGWIWKLPRNAIAMPLALALILGGAVGNLYDRILLGYVVDFISAHWGPHYWPAFNIADSAISVGAAIVLLQAFFEKKEETTA